MNGREHEIEAVYHSHDRNDCTEHALVLHAVGIAHRIVRDADEYSITVPSVDAAHASEELAAYQREHRATATLVKRTPLHSGAWLGVYAYVVVIVLVDILQAQRVLQFDWFGAGKTQADLVLQGQWWRTVTALTLHADTPHLAANLIVGGLFGLFAGQLMGAGSAWLSILVAGAMGNALNAWLQPSYHSSVGSSTAVFAALGMVAAFVWMGRRRSDLPVLARWAPLVGGGVLLGYLGAGGARTDVAAHFLGFLCGLLFGATHGRLAHRLFPPGKPQIAMGALALGIVVLAWVLALTMAR